MFETIFSQIKKVLKANRITYKICLFLLGKIRLFRKGSYSSWIKKKEPALWLPCTTIEKKLFSIVVPVFNTDPKMLRACVDSVLSQIYTNWELILVNDASTDKKTLEALKNIETLSSRVRVVHSQINQHISQATNTGVALATGDFVGFLDHDDTLSPHALNEVAHVLLNNQEVKWVYSDEDFLDGRGERISPHFKTDWNQYLLRSHNYITHFCVYEISVLKQLGGFREGFEGAQDYDMALRVSEVLPVEQIMHIPKILYHWRIHDQSSSSGEEAKPYTVAVGKKALQEHLDRSNVSAVVKNTQWHNFYKVNYILNSKPTVSIIIPTRDQYELLFECVESLINNTSYSSYEIILMDNQTTCPKAKQYLNTLMQNDKVKVVLFDESFNYSKINNEAIKYCRGEYLVLLNNDTKVISSDWLDELVGIASQPNVGCVGAKLLYPDNTIQHAGVVLGLGGYAAHSHRCMSNTHSGYFNRPHLTQNVSAVTGACLLIKKSIYQNLHGLDEGFQVAYNDVDFCLRVQQLGYVNVYCADAVLYHFESKSRGYDNETQEKRIRFNEEKKRLKKKWQHIIDNDPFYNPNLTKDRENFTFF